MKDEKDGQQRKAKVLKAVIMHARKREEKRQQQLPPGSGPAPRAPGMGQGTRPLGWTFRSACTACRQVQQFCKKFNKPIGKFPFQEKFIKRNKICAVRYCSMHWNKDDWDRAERVCNEDNQGDVTIDAVRTCEELNQYTSSKKSCRKLPTTPDERLQRVCKYGQSKCIQEKLKLACTQAADSFNQCKRQNREKAGACRFFGYKKLSSNQTVFIVKNETAAKKARDTGTLCQENDEYWYELTCGINADLDRCFDIGRVPPTTQAINSGHTTTQPDTSLVSSVYMFRFPERCPCSKHFIESREYHVYKWACLCVFLLW